MPPSHSKRNKHASRTPRGWATRTAAEVARTQADLEAKLRGTDALRKALSKPMSLFRLRQSVAVAAVKLGPYEVLVATGCQPDALPAPQRAGAMLMFVNTDRVQVGDISTPVYTFMMMGRAARVVVRDLRLIEPT